MSRSFSVEDVRTSELHRPDARSSFSSFYTELDFMLDMDRETATVRTKGQHRLDVFQASRKISAHVSVFLS
jgi:hypothetical protein